METRVVPSLLPLDAPAKPAASIPAEAPRRFEASPQSTKADQFSESSIAVGTSESDSNSESNKRRPILLFTAFEPSGDDHAAAVIAELKRRQPDLAIYAWGGPKMERAGAKIQERTGEDAVMGLPGIAKVLEHMRINARIDAFMRANNVTLHIPVDSPSANISICGIAKKHGAKVVHLVAPQIWAWGRWRIHKLRRVTDMVLCILPFEEEFFRKRYVPARFIGHFLFDNLTPDAELDRRADAFNASGEPRIAMMPGSRPDELRRHFPILLDAFRALQAANPGAVGIVAATNERVAESLREMAAAHGGWPDRLHIVVQDTDAVIRWCQVAMVKSGTVTLQVAKQRKPMVVFYKKSNPLLFMIARLILSTRVFSLPNVLARKRIIPEFIPHFGGAVPLVQAVERLINYSGEAAMQRHDLDTVLKPYEGMHAASLAADTIEEFAGLRSPAHGYKSRVM